jgi:hypothetical protein
MIVHGIVLKLQRLGLHVPNLLRALMVSSICMTNGVLAQDLEPRAYSNTPTGLNFLLAGYQYSEGALLFDPTLPITDANARVNVALLGYVRTLGIADKSAKIGLLVPVAGLDASGYVDSVFRIREDSGLVDPAFYFSINLFGAPALSFEDFKDFQQDTIVGMTFKLTAPLGVYDNDKLLNIGTNRWSFKPEIGISKAFGPLILEAAAAALLFSDNDDFDGGKTRQQDAIYSLQGHVIYAFRSGIWAAIGATYYSGGRTTIDGVSNDDFQQNWRGGFTLALPIDRRHSIKIYGNSGVSTRTGTDYDSLGIAWQYRWGKGF